MQFRTFFAQDQSGNTVSGATATVYLEGTNTLAVIYDKTGTQIVNPMTTDTSGKVQFAAEDGVYDLFVDAGTRSYNAVIQFLDATDSVTQIQSLTNTATQAATNASGSESTALAHRDAALEHRNFAEAFKNTTQSARDATIVLVDDFETKYLGAKASAPTTDNDGDPLIVGALYWNSTINQMRVWDGVAWGSLDQSDIEARLASSDPDEGASLVSMEGGPTVETAVNARPLYLDSIAQLPTTAKSTDNQVVIVTGDEAGVFKYNESTLTWERQPEYYDGSVSGLSATNNQDAFDEVVNRTEIANINVGGGFDYTLTDNDLVKFGFNLTGTLTANINVIVPNTAREYIVINNTSGAFTLTVKTSAGTGVVVPQGSSQKVRSDGANVVTSIDDFATMPTVGGDPVVESGSNTDGEWVRWADGTQSIYKTGYSVPGNGFSIINLPIAFIDGSYSVFGTSSSSTTGNGVLLKVNGSNKTVNAFPGAAVDVINAGFTGSTLLMDIFATGRWK